VKQRFLTTFKTLMDDQEELIATCLIDQKTLCDCSEIDAEFEELRRKIEVVTELYQKDNLQECPRGRKPG